MTPIADSVLNDSARASFLSIARVQNKEPGQKMSSESLSRKLALAEIAEQNSPSPSFNESSFLLRQHKQRSQLKSGILKRESEVSLDSCHLRILLQAASEETDFIC